MNPSAPSMPALRELVHYRCLQGRPPVIFSRLSRHCTVPKLKSELSVLHTKLAPLPHDSALGPLLSKRPQHLCHHACTRALCRLLSTHLGLPFSLLLPLVLASWSLPGHNLASSSAPHPHTRAGNDS